jgi:hypothetical protein
MAKKSPFGSVFTMTLITSCVDVFGLDWGSDAVSLSAAATEENKEKEHEAINAADVIHMRVFAGHDIRFGISNCGH